MSSSEPSIYCINPECASPRNPLGGEVCDCCNTPLVYRYLWAVGPEAAALNTGTSIEDRYCVVAPQVWLDIQPAQAPQIPEELPETVTPYLFLYPYRLHIPEVYGWARLEEDNHTQEVLLLENVPVDPVGNLYPSLVEAWPTATAVRQVYWLWQLLQLWKPLSEKGVAASLLSPENLRVEGWRVWLLELYSDSKTSSKSKSQPRLQDLAQCWLGWISGAQPAIVAPMKEICHHMRGGDSNWDAIITKLNQLLLEEAAQLPLRLRVAGASDTGPVRDHNEDSCYPTPADLKIRSSGSENNLIPYLSIVCDGVGGHEGGEVASQSAVYSLKPLIQTLLTDVAQSEEITPPDVVIQQLEEIIRVINNIIAAQNDTQGRSARQRMGTTLVMALQLPQKVKTASGAEYANSHELYLAHVGDSRAYWINSDYCQRLTVDDDVASREVRLGRSLYREALDRSDAGALTQALGTRYGEFLRPNVQRFIIEEDGLLLLCSDGLSDNDWVELSWANYAPAVLKGEMPVEVAVQQLVNLANEKNGHDNTSVVMLHCRLSPDPLVLFTPAPEIPTPTPEQKSPSSEFSEASKALLDTETATPAPETPPPVPVAKPKKTSGWLAVGLLLVVVLLTGGAVFYSWSVLKTGQFQLWRDQGSPSQPK